MTLSAVRFYKHYYHIAQASDIVVSLVRYRLQFPIIRELARLCEVCRWQSARHTWRWKARMGQLRHRFSRRSLTATEAGLQASVAVSATVLRVSCVQRVDCIHQEILAAVISLLFNIERNNLHFCNQHIFW